jgi:hypothetical protein
MGGPIFDHDDIIELIPQNSHYQDNTHNSDISNMQQSGSPLTKIEIKSL